MYSIEIGSEAIFKDRPALSALYEIGRLSASRSVGYGYDRYSAPEAGQSLKMVSTSRFRGHTEKDIPLISRESPTGAHGVV